jgi:putative hydrolase of the HAD superfamily
MYEALLLDIGYVIIGVSWRAIEALEATTGVARSDGGRGRFDPSTDDRWRSLRAGEISSDQYWGEVARARGLSGLGELFMTVARTVPDEMFDLDALRLMADARTAGRRVGVLSNDAYSFLGKEWFAGRPEFAGLDAFVDATDVGARKPDPKAYLAAATALGVEADAVVFLDDTPECVDGANRVGMTGVLVDPYDRTPAFDAARRLLGLEPNTDSRNTDSRNTDSSNTDSSNTDSRK